MAKRTAIKIANGASHEQEKYWNRWTGRGVQYAGPFGSFGVSDFGQGAWQISPC